MKSCYTHCSGAGLYTEPQEFTSEHQTVKSRLDGKDHEIMFGPLPANADPSKGGLVPSNPFASGAQRAYLNMHPDILGKKALHEWNEASKGQHVPYHVKKK